MAVSTPAEATTTRVAMIEAIHEGIPVADLEASRRFYAEVLGLKELPRPDFGFPGYWLGDDTGRVEIHLFPSDEVKPGPNARPSNVARHTAYTVSDLEGWKARLRALGVEFIEMSGFVRSAQVFVTDPDGHTIEFQQAYPAS